jgi:hypothetical protein
MGISNAGCQSAAIGARRIADSDTDATCRRRFTRTSAGAVQVRIVAGCAVTPSVRAHVHDTHRPAVSIRLIGITTIGCESAAVGARRVADSYTDPACRRRSTRATAEDGCRKQRAVSTATPSGRAHVHDTHRPAVSIRLIGSSTAGCESAAVGARRVADIDTDPACSRCSTSAVAGAPDGNTVTPSGRAHVHDTHRPAVSIRLIGITAIGCESAAVGAGRIADSYTDPACRRRSTRATAGAAGGNTETPSVRAHVHDTRRPSVSIPLIGITATGCQSAAVGARRIADCDTDVACSCRSTRAAAGAAGGNTETPSVRAHVHDTHRPSVSICLIGISKAGCQSAAVGARRVADIDTDATCRRRFTNASAGAAGGKTVTPSGRAHVHDTH